MTTTTPTTLARIIEGSIERKEWRSSAEAAALAYLPRGASRAEREEVKAQVRKAYDEAGAGYAGRWQS